MLASLDENVIAEHLVSSGMGRAEAVRKGRCFTQTLASLDECGDSSAVGSAAGNPYLLFVPGRIEVLGKHTDYAGGSSLLAAVERGFSIAARSRSDCRLRIMDAASGEVASFALAADLVPAVGHWSNYPMTVARRVARNFPGPLCGADIAFKSDLPPAAGMSSSSALITGMFKVLSQVNRLTEREEYRAHLGSAEALAAYLATIENGQSFASLAGDRGVGTFGGSEDHTAICCCRPGVLHEYVFCPVRFQQAIPLPAGHVFALGASGVLAEKTGEAMAKYNRASRLVARCWELWQADTGRGDRCLADAVHSAPGAADRLRRIVAERPHADFDGAALLRRLEHFLDENERIIPAAARALAARGDGRLRRPGRPVAAWGRRASAEPGPADDRPGSIGPAVRGRGRLGVRSRFRRKCLGAGQGRVGRGFPGRLGRSLPQGIPRRGAALPLFPQRRRAGTRRDRNGQPVAGQIMISREKIPTHVFPSAGEASLALAREIAALIRSREAEGRSTVLGLATGATPIGVYNELVRMHQQEGLSFRSVVSFNLDEYYPIQRQDLQSYYRFMHEYLFDHLDMRPENVHIPDGTITTGRVPEFCERHEQAIRDAGGIDIQILGIGRTGHIGFNEPGSSRNSRTRLITLDRLTRLDAASDFFGEQYVPRRAITMGVGTILAARKVVLLSFGEHKAGVIAQAVEGPVTPAVAASFLQEHPHAQILLDEAAAAELTRRKSPWLLGAVPWDETLVRKAVIWLARKLTKAILKLTDEDYNEAGLQDLWPATARPTPSTWKSSARFRRRSAAGPAASPSRRSDPATSPGRPTRFFPSAC